jgi:hypothetical protein
MSMIRLRWCVCVCARARARRKWVHSLTASLQFCLSQLTDIKLTGTNVLSHNAVKVSPAEMNCPEQNDYKML